MPYLLLISRADDSWTPTEHFASVPLKRNEGEMLQYTLQAIDRWCLQRFGHESDGMLPQRDADNHLVFLFTCADQHFAAIVTTISQQETLHA